MAQIVPSVTVPVILSNPGKPKDNFDLASLARDVAMGIHELPDILAANNITEADYETLKTNPFYEKLLAASVMEWQSVRNTVERTAIEAAACFEQAMPHIFARMVNVREPLNHVVEAAKLMAKAGGIGENTNKGGPGEKFSITINLGGDTKLAFNPNKAPNDPQPIIDVTPEPMVEITTEPALDEERV